MAELAGAFTLSFVGAGSIIVDSYTGGEIGVIGIALAHGLAVAVAVSATINISGGQINPAITIGLVIIGKEKVPQALANIVSQLLGALIAGILLKGLFPAEAAAAKSFFDAPNSSHSNILEFRIDNDDFLRTP